MENKPDIKPRRHCPPVLIICFLLLVQFQGHGQSTASPNVSIISVHSTQMETEKNIWIYLPASYKASTKNYPVLYLQDAQNLFDSSTSFSGEWRVDEILDSLKLDLIVVGIEHGNAKRIDELTPYAHPEHGGGNAVAYLDFITKTLKPQIDSLYRTKPTAASTFIGGSSLGGLFAYYSILKHPEIFSKALVFSPSFWFSDEIVTLTKQTHMEALSATKIFFRAGHKESETMVPLMMKMRQILIDKGMSMCDINSKAVFEGTHSEKFWASQFPEAALWLISN